MSGRTFFLISFGLFAGACSDSRLSGPRSDSAQEAIPSIYKTMEDAFFKGDAETIARAYTDDAEWYVPEAPVLKGRAAIGRAWKTNVGGGGNRLRIEVAEVQQYGSRAHAVGRFTISAPDGAVLSAGKYIVIWARQTDGEWKTYRDIFNLDIPPRQADRTTVHWSARPVYSREPVN